jgi:hypothetical protein
LTASDRTLPRLGKRKDAVTGIGAAGFADLGACAGDLGMGVEEIGQDGDGLVVARGVGVQQEHVIGRASRAASSCSTTLLPRPKPWFVRLGMEDQPPLQPRAAMARR